jgi:Domain of unknown function (DUF313)
MTVTDATMDETKRKFSEYIHQDDSEYPPAKKINTTGRRSPRSPITYFNRLRIPAGLSLVDHPTFILRKNLQPSDLKLSQSRLLLARNDVVASPLFGILTSKESELVLEQGLTVRAFDQHEREYELSLRFLKSNNSYRLKNHWNQFLRQNAGEIKAGDPIEIWMFHILKEDGSTKIGMALVHYGKEDEPRQEQEQEGTEPTKNELEAVEGLLMLNP